MVIYLPRKWLGESQSQAFSFISNPVMLFCYLFVCANNGQVTRQNVKTAARKFGFTTQTSKRKGEETTYFDQCMDQLEMVFKCIEDDSIKPENETQKEAIADALKRASEARENGTLFFKPLKWCVGDFGKSFVQLKTDLTIIPEFKGNGGRRLQYAILLVMNRATRGFQRKVPLGPNKRMANINIGKGWAYIPDQYACTKINVSHVTIIRIKRALEKNRKLTRVRVSKAFRCELLKLGVPT